MESEKILLANIEKKATEYANKIIAAKEELKVLESDKKATIESCKKEEERTKKKIQTERDNFNRVIAQENTRLANESADFEKKKVSHNKMNAETVRLNNEAKANSQKTTDALNKANEELEKAIKRRKDYDAKLIAVQQKDADLDGKLKSIQPQLDKIEKAKKENIRVENENTRTSQALSAKQTQVNEKAAFLIKKEASIEKRETKCINKEQVLKVREEDVAKSEKENADTRSDLEAGQRNLNELKAELDDLIKLKKLKK